jgi:hypothetical protein
MNTPNSCIVRVFNQYGVPTGAGLLISEKKILTCAHVVNSALGQEYDPGQIVQTSIVFDIPQIISNQTLTAYVDIWDKSNDISVLCCNEKLPFNPVSASLILEKDMWGDQFRVFGFPSGYDHGVWAAGVLRGRTSNNWLQIEGKSNSGYMIQPGFSGSPVFNEQAGGIVGIITAADLDPNVRAAYVIPSDILAKTVPELKNNVSESITRLGQLGNLSRAELHNKLRFHRKRLSHKSTPSNLLSVSLILLMLKSYDEAIQFLEQFLSQNPLYAYGWYTLALANLKGNRPRLLKYDTASSIHKQALKAIQLDPNLVQATLLLAFLNADYFEIKGFQVKPDLQSCLQLIQNKRIKKKEVLSLLKLIPDNPSIPMISYIQAITTKNLHS